MYNPSNARYGDMKKFAVTADGVDISEAVTTAAVYQDIFTPTWSAQIELNDTSNLLMTLPLAEGSKVKITVETETKSPLDDKKEFSFVVYKIGDHLFQNHMQQSYVLYCVSDAFIKNQVKRVQKAYDNKKASDIVSDITSEFLGGSCEAKGSEQNVQIIIPNWSPFNAISWCSKVATYKGIADYVFFQSDNDKYRFDSHENMFTNESSDITFFQRPAEMKKEDGTYEYDYSLAFSDFSFDHSDAEANLASGMYQNKLLTYDMIGKNWESKVFRYGDDIGKDKDKKPWKGDLFEQGEDANISFLPKHAGLFASTTYLDNADVWQTSRKSAFRKLDQERFIFQIPGSVGCYKLLGKTVNIELTSMEEMTKETLDKYRKGKYLVCAIAHIMGKDAYICNVEGIKKRLEDTLESAS